MTVGVTSPDVGNLAVGKGFILFKPTDQSSFFHVGNVPTFTFTPKATVLDHYTAMAGSKIKDLSIITEKSGEVKMDLEELTAQNLAMLVMGTVGTDASTPANPQVQIFSRSSFVGELKFYATNEVGPRWYVDLLSVNLVPSGDFSQIVDNAFMKMPITGSVQAIDGVFGTMTLMGPVSAVAPTNVLLPTITGMSGTPAGTPHAGDILTANIGAWVGPTSYTYAWQSGTTGTFTPIVGQTSKTYTVVSGDTGKAFEVIVTGVNSKGSTPATSAPTLVTV
jgi:hypothetical protein